MLQQLAGLLLALHLVGKQDGEDGGNNVGAQTEVERRGVGAGHVEQEGAHEGTERRTDAHDDERGEAPDPTEGSTAKDGTSVASSATGLDAPVDGQQDHTQADDREVAGQCAKDAGDTEQRRDDEHETTSRALDAHLNNEGVRNLTGDRHRIGIAKMPAKPMSM